MKRAVLQARSHRGEVRLDFLQPADVIIDRLEVRFRRLVSVEEPLDVAPPRQSQLPHLRQREFISPFEFVHPRV